MRQPAHGDVMAPLPGKVRGKGADRAPVVGNPGSTFQRVRNCQQSGDHILIDLWLRHPFLLGIV
jgi:hypothetical protein